MIDRIRQVGHLCRPFGVAKEHINITKYIYTNVNIENRDVARNFKGGGEPLSQFRADPGIYFRVKPSSSIESWGRSPNWGRESNDNLRGRSPNKGEANRAPPQKIFEKSNLESFILVHIWDKHLK